MNKPRMLLILLSLLVSAAILSCGEDTLKSDEPSCSITPSELDFGDVDIDAEPAERTFTISCTGDVPLTGSVSASCSTFSIVSGDGEFELAPGEERVITVQFDPFYFKTDTCFIETGMEPCDTVTCIGEGVIIDGGPCDYTHFDGTATILSVGPPHLNNYNCTRSPVEVLFVFTPYRPSDIERYRFPEWSDTALLTTLGGANPNEGWVRMYGVEPGSVHECVRLEIVTGACTPVGFEFPAFDMMSAIDSCYNRTGPTGSLIEHSSCGGFNQPEADPVDSGSECLAYEYDGASVLTITHYHSDFNCCPDRLHAEVSAQDGVILLTESEILTFPCTCLCLYDFKYSVDGLWPGIYTIRVNELAGYNAGQTPLEITVDLSAATSGLHCEDRPHYPWGFD